MGLRITCGAGMPEPVIQADDPFETIIRAKRITAGGDEIDGALKCFPVDMLIGGN